MAPQHCFAFDAGIRIHRDEAVFYLFPTQYRFPKTHVFLEQPEYYRYFSIVEKDSWWYDSPVRESKQAVRSHGLAGSPGVV